MKLTPKALAAADLLIQTTATFQSELAPLNAACDTMIDFMTQLRGDGEIAGEITDEILDRLISARETISGLAAAVDALKIIQPACDIISHELGITT